MAQNTSINDVLTRVRKLMNLAENPSATEGEAANAAAMAQKLLIKYNLSMAQIKDVDEPSDYENRNVNLGVAKGQVIGWRRSLLFTLAEENFCRALQWSSGPLANTMQVIGKPENIEMVMSMFEYLTATIERLSREGWDEFRKNNHGQPPTIYSEYTHKYQPMHYKAWLSSFAKGANLAIKVKLRAQRKEMITADRETTAIVLVIEEELDNAVTSFYDNVGKGKKDKSAIYDAIFEAGYTAGKSISLDKQVSGTTRTAGALN